MVLVRRTKRHAWSVYYAHAAARTQSVTAALNVYIVWCLVKLMKLAARVKRLNPSCVVRALKAAHARHETKFGLHRPVSALLSVGV